MRRHLRRAKRKLVRTPGGRLVWHRVEKRVKGPRCAICGKPLHGTYRNRPFGNICIDCYRELLIRRVIKYASQQG